MSSGSTSYILFPAFGYHLGHAADAVEQRGLSVSRGAEQLVVRSGDGPVAPIALVTGEHVRAESVQMGAGTPHAGVVGQCDTRFEISFDDLPAMLDEMNTLMEIQMTLQDATHGFLFNEWTGKLTAYAG